MLSVLSIRNIVLIEALDLSFAEGLTVLTGETGAGKSILLDSVSLAIGARADRALVRDGAEKGQVTASFDIEPDARLRARLDEAGLTEHSPLILRRQITKDGRSKAWINDMPVSQSLLADVGARLIEIHGQHDDRALLDPSGHRALLDQFGGYTAELDAYRSTFGAYETAQAVLQDAEEALAAARGDEDYLRHAVDELDALAPIVGEEEALALERATMMQGEKLAEELSGFQDALAADGSAEGALRGVLRRMERLDEGAQDILKPVMDALSRAAIELAEGVEGLDRIAQSLDFDPHRLEETEARLFELRRVARKHACSVDDLVALQKTLGGRLAAVDQGDATLVAAKQNLEEARVKLVDAAAALRSRRCEAASSLDALVMQELAPLKLEKAAFRTVVEPLTQEHWSLHGGDRAEFEVKTNPGTPFGPLTKIASGGETARFVLALKVVLGTRFSMPVMIFDEVDRGIGGATADAVGERLARLAERAQLLVVTHSPQVAARGSHHLTIAKSDTGTVTKTQVTELAPADRTEEIARMLAGATITPEARAAAVKLLSVEGSQ